VTVENVPDDTSRQNLAAPPTVRRHWERKAVLVRVNRT
jgi:hypothetical protein